MPLLELDLLFEVESLTSVFLKVELKHLSIRFFVKSFLNVERFPLKAHAFVLALFLGTQAVLISAFNWH